MKKHYYTLWFRIVNGFFWIISITNVLCVLMTYVMWHWHIWS